jgi:hypothetical protein
VDSGEQAATESGEHVFPGAISHTGGELLLAKPLSVPLGDMIVSGYPSFDAGEVRGPLAELFGCLLQREAELLPEGPEVGDVWSCDRVEYLAVDFTGDVAFEAAHGFSCALAAAVRLAT